MKYNYNLDANIQNYLQFDSLIQLSNDGEELIITNKRQNPHAQYKLTSDPNEVKK